MPDNTPRYPTNADDQRTEASDDISSVWYSIHKLAFGALDAATLVSTSNGLPVNIVTDTVGIGGGTQYATDAALGATPTGMLAMAARDDALSALTPVEGDAVHLRVDANGALWVIPNGTVTVDGSGVTQPVSGTVTANLGATDNAVLDSIDAAVNGTVTVDLGANNDVIASGDVAADALDSGNPVKVGGKVVSGTVNNYGDGDRGDLLLSTEGAVVIAGQALTGDAVTASTVAGAYLRASNNAPRLLGSMGYMYNGTTADRIRGNTTDGLLVNLGTNNDVSVTSLPASTNTIEVVGDVATDAAAAGNPIAIGGQAVDQDDTAPPTRVSTEGDRTVVATTFEGAAFVAPHGPQVWSYHLNTSTAQTDTSVHAAAGANLALKVGTLSFSHDGTAAINLFFEEATNTRLGPFYLPATAGGVTIQFNPPRILTANTALTLTTSASHAHSVDVTGEVVTI